MNEENPRITIQNEVPNLGGEPRADAQNTKLVRLIKTITVGTEKPKYLDESVVRYTYYNSFNYSLLSQEHQNVNMALGVTSANAGEGKTLVACNFGVSLALGSQKKTLLIDLNVVNPRLHQIFGTLPHPGLAEAFLNGTIHVYRTVFDHLFVLPLGRFLISSPGAQAGRVADEGGEDRQSLGLEQLAAFRDVIYSLQQEFDIIIVDMPSLKTEGVPVLFANQLNGLIVVVDSSRTHREDVDAILRQVNERQVLGFVLNRFKH